MNAKEIAQALGISLDDPPPWDGEIHAVCATFLGYRVRVLSVMRDRAMVEVIATGVILRTRAGCLNDIVCQY